MHPALVIFLILLGGLLSIVPFVYLNIRRTGETRLLLPAPESSHGNQHRMAESHGRWAKHFGFEWIGGYTFRSLQKSFIGAWRHTDQPVFFLLEMANGSTHYHFISIFNRKQELTSTSQNGLVVPRPKGDYVQRFPKASLTDLFMHHAAGHDFLLTEGHAKLAPYALRVDRALVNGLARQYAHVTAMKAWPLRALAWVLIEPRRADGHTIADQLADVPPAHAKPPELQEEPSDDTDAKSDLES
ncbi:MAG: hypothetical protein OXT09_12465 [Myxococcales bacterium]|nr:hypothetical protein [Myxococcales bacterium]